jgi:hypothetical protein
MYSSQREQPRQPSFTRSPQYGQYGTTYQGQPQYSPPSYGGDPYPQGEPPPGQQPSPSQGHRRHSGQQAPRKRRRAFLWVFLAIQALFIIWIIVGVATVHTGPTQAQLAQGCYNGNWYPLFKSQADCVQHYGGALNDAATAGKAIGVGLVIAFWVWHLQAGPAVGLIAITFRSKLGWQASDAALAVIVAVCDFP